MGPSGQLHRPPYSRSRYPPKRPRWRSNACNRSLSPSQQGAHVTGDEHVRSKEENDRRKEEDERRSEGNQGMREGNQSWQQQEWEKALTAAQSNNRRKNDKGRRSKKSEIDAKAQTPQAANEHGGKQSETTQGEDLNPALGLEEMTEKKTVTPKPQEWHAAPEESGKIEKLSQFMHSNELPPRPEQSGKTKRPKRKPRKKQTESSQTQELPLVPEQSDQIEEFSNLEKLQAAVEQPPKATPHGGSRRSSKEKRNAGRSKERQSEYQPTIYKTDNELQQMGKIPEVQEFGGENGKEIANEIQPSQSKDRPTAFQQSEKIEKLSQHAQPNFLLPRPEQSGKAKNVQSQMQTESSQRKDLPPTLEQSVKAENKVEPPPSKELPPALDKSSNPEKQTKKQPRKQFRHLPEHTLKDLRKVIEQSSKYEESAKQIDEKTGNLTEALQVKELPPAIKQSGNTEKQVEKLHDREQPKDLPWELELSVKSEKQSETFQSKELPPTIQRFKEQSDQIVKGPNKTKTQFDEPKEHPSMEKPRHGDITPAVEKAPEVTRSNDLPQVLGCSASGGFFISGSLSVFSITGGRSSCKEIPEASSDRSNAEGSSLGCATSRSF